MCTSATYLFLFAAVPYTPLASCRDNFKLKEMNMGGVVLRGLLRPAWAICILCLPLLSCADLNYALERLDLVEPDSASLTESTLARPESDDATAAALEKQSALPTDLKPPASAKPSTVEGTGRFINPSAATRRQAAPAENGDLTLNFVDTDIKEVVRSVLGDMLRLNYVIDPKVQGMITLQTTQPIPMQDALPTLESVLRLSNVAIVESSGLYRVIPVEAAARSEVIPRLRQRTIGAGSAFGVQIVPLKHISAGEMANILEPFAPKGSILRTDRARNLLLLAGARNERQSMSEIVRIFDVDWFAGMSFALVPLRYSDAQAVADDLDKVFGEGSEDAPAGMVRVTPIERMNSILVITPQRVYLKRAKDWIERLDVGNPTRDRRLYVYDVQNMPAVELAAVLNQIFGGSVEVTERQETGRLAPGLQPAEIRSPTLDRSRSSERSRPTSRLRDELASQSVFQQRNARPSGAAAGTPATPAAPAPQSESPAPVPRAPQATASGSGTSLSDQAGIRIIANDINNSLLILATPTQYREIAAALRRLDVTPLQVLIEATIAEVRLSDQLRYGVKWFFDTGNTEITFSDLPGGAVEPIFPGFSVLFSSASDVRVVIDALDSVTDVNVVSSPQLMVLDNRTAELLVGDQVPVATQSSVSVNDPDAPIVNSIEFRDTGVVLKVTPRVNASGLVTLEIEQEVSDVVETTTSGIDSPTIQQRRIQSSVAIESGETVALGGLIRNRRTDLSDGVPFLSRIPLVGALFGTKENVIEKTELLVLITPRVVRDRKQAREITEELRSRIDAFRPKPKDPEDENKP